MEASTPRISSHCCSVMSQHRQSVDYVIIVSLILQGFHPGLRPGLIPLLILRFKLCVEVSPLHSPPITVCEVADSVVCQVAMLPSFNSL